MRRNTIWRCDVNVHVVADVELGLEKRQIVVGIALAGAGDADFTHPVAWTVRLNEGKVKVGALAASLRVDVSHESGQFL